MGFYRDFILTQEFQRNCGTDLEEQSSGSVGREMDRILWLYFPL